MKDEEEVQKSATEVPEKEKSPPGLRQLRESKGLSIKAASSETRISPSVLTAIENEAFELLPEPVYSRAFIGTYARFLGAEGLDVLKRYNEYTAEKERGRLRRESSRKEARSQMRRGIVLLVVLILCALAFFSYQYFFSGNDSSGITQQVGVVMEQADRPDTMPVAGSPVEPPVPEDAGVIRGEEAPAPEETAMPEPIVPPAPEPQPPETPQYTSHHLHIEATEWTWLEITRDDDLPFEILMKPGDTLSRDASDKFVMIVGNASGVRITFNGEPLGSLGKHGEVVLLTLPREKGAP